MPLNGDCNGPTQCQIPLVCNSTERNWQGSKISFLFCLKSVKLIVVLSQLNGSIAQANACCLPSMCRASKQAPNAHRSSKNVVAKSMRLQNFLLPNKANSSPFSESPVCLSKPISNQCNSAYKALELCASANSHCLPPFYSAFGWLSRRGPDSCLQEFCKEQLLEFYCCYSCDNLIREYLIFGVFLRTWERSVTYLHEFSFSERLEVLRNPTCF